MANTPAAARSIFRKLLRCANKLPTQERRDWLRSDVLSGFRANAHVSDQTQINKLISQSEKYLDILGLRSRALSLYRGLFRASRHMPTANRVEFVRRRTRSEFMKNRDVVEPEEVKELLNLAEFQLESVDVQATHLKTIFETPGYHNDKIRGE
ncbi:hypothetical protein TL16_g07321 [Triparma laevis f. inornata]|uniref:Complex 1 LYR protein domain-containing protein n=2 Tax=Triparma laevis TaxID=1534972 RepID=A0A9W7DQG8_9STRA|nr:hypothetical protein TrLO_g4260 [Triparma laevis f. longispina]GMH77181.1 hypothetical protein TL16_g07321 [Triparma laevis f. inornata]